MSGRGPVHAIPDEALGNTSYLVALDQNTAISIDPRRDATEHLQLADRLGLRITGVLETHLHADFVSGAREIAAVTGAPIFAAADAAFAFPYSPVSPDAPIAIGPAVVETIATPGHTPEHLVFLLSANGERALFTGGSLIVGGAARTDLTGAERTDELARAQFTSLRRLAALPDDTLVFPTHGAGSFCSTGQTGSASSTIGAERRSNRLFTIADEETFVEELRAGFGTYPRYFASLREVNRAGAPLLHSLAPVSEITVEEASASAERGVWLIDGRPAQAWAEAHATGSISIAVRPAFPSWLGWAVPFGAPVVLLLEPSQLAEAVQLARRIGYDRIEGWTTFDAWRKAGLPVSSVDTLTPSEAAERDTASVRLLDVRQDGEWVSGRIPGATHLELGDIIAGSTPDASNVLAYCAHGDRTATAASFLELRGLQVAVLRGGITAWRRAGLPVEP